VIKNRYSTGTTTNTLYEINGKEIWHMEFIHDDHPVNKKWRMSGQPPREDKEAEYAI
jgi:hypothetical protein